MGFGSSCQSTIKNLIKRKTWVNELLREIESTFDNPSNVKVFKVSPDIVSERVENSSSSCSCSANSKLNISIEEIVSPTYPGSSSYTVSVTSSEEMASGTKNHRAGSKARVNDDKAVPKKSRSSSESNSRVKSRKVSDADVKNGNRPDATKMSTFFSADPSPFQSDIRLSMEDYESLSQGSHNEGRTASGSESSNSREKSVGKASKSSYKLRSDDTQDTGRSPKSVAVRDEQPQQVSAEGEAKEIKIVASQDQHHVKKSSSVVISGDQLPINSPEESRVIRDGTIIASGTGYKVVATNTRPPRLFLLSTTKGEGIKKFIDVTDSSIVTKDFKLTEYFFNNASEIAEQMLNEDCDKEMEPGRRQVNTAVDRIKSSVEQKSYDNNHKPTVPPSVGKSFIPKKVENSAQCCANEESGRQPVKKSGEKSLSQSKTEVLADKDKPPTSSEQASETVAVEKSAIAASLVVASNQNVTPKSLGEQQQLGASQLTVLSDWNVVSKDDVIENIRRDSFRRSESTPGGPEQPSRLDGQQLSRGRNRRRSISVLGAKEYLKSFREKKTNDALVKKAQTSDLDEKSKSLVNTASAGQVPVTSDTIPTVSSSEIVAINDQGTSKVVPGDLPAENSQSTLSIGNSSRQFLKSAVMNAEFNKDNVGASDKSMFEYDSNTSYRKGGRSPERMGVSFARDSSLKIVFDNTPSNKIFDGSASNTRLPPISEESEPHEMITIPKEVHPNAILSARRKSVISRVSDANSLLDYMREIDDDSSFDDSVPSSRTSSQLQCKCRLVCSCCTCGMSSRKHTIERASTFENQISTEASAVTTGSHQSQGDSMDLSSPPFPKNSLAVLSSPFYAHWSYYDIDIDHPIGRYLKQFDSRAADVTDCVLLKNVQVGGYYLPFMNVCAKKKISSKVICNYYKTRAKLKRNGKPFLFEGDSSSSLVGAPVEEEVPACKCKDGIWKNYVPPKEEPVPVTDEVDAKEEPKITGTCCKDSTFGCLCMKADPTNNVVAQDVPTTPCQSCDCFISQVASETSTQSIVRVSQEVTLPEDSIGSRNVLVSEYISNLQDLCSQLCAMIGRMKLAVSETPSGSSDNPITIMKKEWSVAEEERHMTSF